MVKGNINALRKIPEDISDNIKLQNGCHDNK